MNDLKCDKCKSVDIIECRKHPSKKTYELMSEYVKSGGFQALSVTTTGAVTIEYIVKCKNCGYELEYTRNEGCYYID